MTGHDDPAAPQPSLPEMSRPFPVSRIGNGATATVSASADELQKLARRMGVTAIDALDCRFELSPALAGAIRAEGTLRASVQLLCVVSLDNITQAIDEDFAVCFVPAGTESEDIDLEAEDEIGYVNGVLDLGEAAAEQLALALDPFPRKPGVALPDAAEERAGGAFASLAALRRGQVDN